MCPCSGLSGTPCKLSPHRQGATKRGRCPPPLQPSVSRKQDPPRAPVTPTTFQWAGDCAPPPTPIPRMPRARTSAGPDFRMPEAQHHAGSGRPCPVYAVRKAGARSEGQKGPREGGGPLLLDLRLAAGLAGDLHQLLPVPLLRLGPATAEKPEKRWAPHRCRLGWPWPPNVCRTHALSSHSAGKMAMKRVSSLSRGDVSAGNSPVLRALALCV